MWKMRSTWKDPPSCCFWVWPRKEFVFPFHFNPHQNWLLSGTLRMKLFTPASLLPLWSWQLQSIQRNETAPGKDSLGGRAVNSILLCPPHLCLLSITSDWMVASTSTYLTCNKLQSIVRIATSQNSCMPHGGTCKIRGADSVVKLYGIYLILRDDRRKAGLFLFSRNMTFQLREWTQCGGEKPKARKERERQERV